MSGERPIRYSSRTLNGLGGTDMDYCMTDATMWRKPPYQVEVRMPLSQQWLVMWPFLATRLEALAKADYIMERCRHELRIVNADGEEVCVYAKRS